MLAGKKRKSKNRGPFQQRSEDFGNSKNYTNNRQSNTRGKTSQYYCDICGTTLPKYGNDQPLCPRCLIPMLQVRNETPGFKSSRKTSYDYSSRIFYPTEGHPQYKNLPKNHPDPDDEEAMAYYNAQRERDRHQNQNKNQNQSQNQSQNQNQGSGDQRGSKNRRNKPFQRRPRSDDQGPSSERDHRHREREPRETMRENALDVVVKTPLPVRVEPVGDPVKESTDERESRGVREHRPSSRSRKPRPPKSKLQIDTASVSHDDEATDKMLREEDYTGTALTSDRSAATILSDAKRDSSHTSQGLVHSDYETGSNIAPKEQDNRSS